MLGRRSQKLDSMRCSFCHKTESVVGKLISSPSDYPRAYICDECIAVCSSIIEDDRLEGSPEEILSVPLHLNLFQGICLMTRREAEHLRDHLNELLSSSSTGSPAQPLTSDMEDAERIEFHPMQDKVTTVRTNTGSESDQPSGQS